MDEFLKMEIFFFVATVAVIVFVFFTALVLWRLERVLKNIERISEQVVLESDIVRQDLAGMRDDIHHGIGRIKSLFNFFEKFMRRRTKKS